MSDLDERLKQLRVRAHHEAISSTTRNEPQDEQNARNTQSRSDEIEDLLRAMKEVVDVEGRQQLDNDNDDARYDDDHDDETINEDFGSDEVSEWLRSDGDDLINTDTVHDLAAKTAQHTKEANEALAQLRKEETASVQQHAHSTAERSDQRSKLIIEPKDKPILVRDRFSRPYDEHRAQEANYDSLADDLADAIGQDVSAYDNKTLPTSSSSHQVSIDAAHDAQHDDDLSARLANLRKDNLLALPTSAQKPVDAPVHTDEMDFLGLPSAPKEQPKPVPSSASMSDDWRVRHGVEGRDLSAFATLARLDAKNLAAPTLFRKSPSQTTDTKDDGLGNPDDWCCICNEDAQVTCVGCDDDLYCHNCWHEGHETMGEDEKREHRRKTVISTSKRKRQLAAA